MNRYFIDPNGAKTFRAQGRPGEGHVDIGQEVLAANGVIPKDKQDIYDQMFRLGYMRIVEHPGRILEVEFPGRMTSAQKRFIAEMESAKWRIYRVDHDR
jgi:hypothetical protein